MLGNGVVVELLVGGRWWVVVLLRGIGVGTGMCVGTIVVGRRGVVCRRCLLRGERWGLGRLCSIDDFA
jgi:hypothetical protein